jgi:hypothetical protein
VHDHSSFITTTHSTSSGCTHLPHIHSPSPCLYTQPYTYIHPSCHTFTHHTLTAYAHIQPRCFHFTFLFLVDLGEGGPALCSDSSTQPDYFPSLFPLLPFCFAFVLLDNSYFLHSSLVFLSLQLYTHPERTLNSLWCH